MFTRALTPLRAPLRHSLTPLTPSLRHSLTPSLRPPHRSLCTRPPTATHTLKPKKSNTRYYVAGALLVLGAVCGEDLYHYPDGLLSRSELFPLIADWLGALSDSFNDALQPTSDELLPEWPTAPCYAGASLPHSLTHSHSAHLLHHPLTHSHSHTHTHLPMCILT